MTKNISALEAISLDESKQLIESEKIIQAGVKTFVEVGVELEKIRIKRLYRAEFRTFQEYCNKRWRFSKSRAQQLISAAATMTSHPEAILTVVTTEGAARALKKATSGGAKSSKTRRVNRRLERAAKNGEQLTARDIEEVAEPKQLAAPVVQESSTTGADAGFTLLEFRKFLERQNPKDAEKFADIAQQFGEGVTDRTSPLLLAQFIKALNALEERIPDGDVKHHEKYGVALNAVAERQMNWGRKSGASIYTR